MAQLSTADLQKLNDQIADRQNVFYWQADRMITPQQAGAIWVDRHSSFTDEQIIAAVNAELHGEELASVVPFKPDAQTTLGNVNHVRIGTLKSGRDVIIRCHPRGVRNGYFHAESLATQRALEAGLPAYKTYAIHDLKDESDFAFQVIERLPGDTVQFWLEQHPEDEPKIIYDMGVCFAKLHQIRVDGFGPFDNTKAKAGKLQGLHSTYAAAVRAGLEFNLRELVKRDVLTQKQADAIDALMAADSPLLACDQAVIIHNDFADWNAMTDGQKITGMIDWDECVAGDPVTDIACWSTFFEPERLDGMLAGYWSVATKSRDFDEKFQLLRLRYTVSKMTLRLRRYEYSPTDAVKNRIEVGKKHLAISLDYFGIA